jgi:hypothetical protein
MARRITIILGHPDAACHHLWHVLADFAIDSLRFNSFIVLEQERTKFSKILASKSVETSESLSASIAGRLYHARECYLVDATGSIRCSYGVLGNMTYG